MIDTDAASASKTSQVERWLLLIHQLPAKPAYLRVKIWRRRQALGAVAVKNAVYACLRPNTARRTFSGC